MLLFPSKERAYQNKVLKATDFELTDLYTNTMLSIGKYYNDGLYYLDTDKLIAEDCKNGSLYFKEGACYSKNVKEHNDEEFAVDEKTFQKYFEQFYGLSYKKLDFFTNQFNNYYYQNGYYFGYIGGGGYAYENGFETSTAQFNKLETKDNEKYIYVNYVYQVLHCQDEACEKDVT